MCDNDKKGFKQFEFPSTVDNQDAINSFKSIKTSAEVIYSKEKKQNLKESINILEKTSDNNKNTLSKKNDNKRNKKSKKTTPTPDAKVFIFI